jgi:hypothetical protein
MATEAGALEAKVLLEEKPSDAALFGLRPRGDEQRSSLCAGALEPRSARGEPSALAYASI